MLNPDWIEHRRGDGELLGWMSPEGEKFVPVDLLGRPLTDPVDWLAAEEVLEAVGIGYLADPYELKLDDGQWLRVRVTEVSTDRILVKKTTGATSGRRNWATRCPGRFPTACAPWTCLTKVSCVYARVMRWGPPFEDRDLGQPPITRRAPGEPSPDPRHHVLAVVRGSPARSRPHRRRGHLVNTPLDRHRHAERLQHIARDPGVTERIQVQAVSGPIADVAQRLVAPIVDKGDILTRRPAEDRVGKLVAAGTHERTERNMRRRVRTADHEHVGTRIDGTIDDLHEHVGDIHNGHPRSHDVVATTVDAHQLGLHREGRLELFRDERASLRPRIARFA